MIYFFASFMLIRYFLRPLFIGIIINAVALYTVTEFFPDKLIIIGGVKTFVLAGFLIGFINFFIKPILKLLSLPFIVLTMGLFLILINGFVLYLAEWMVNTFGGETLSMIVQGGFFTYLLIAFIFGIMNWLLSFILRS